ncbi:MAG TPA: M3 family metallopeptidase [Pseudomonadales bacterium]|nr:M3 family metallopeptidase [Pseudomonadales bacterium]
MSNPLLRDDELPAFNEIQAEQIEPALDSILADNRALLNQLLQQEQPSWDSFIAPYEEFNNRLDNAWSPVSHLHSVANNEALRLAHAAAQAKLSAYHTELGQNTELYRVFKTLSEQAESLPTERKRFLENAVRDFHLSGVHLSAEKKQRFATIVQRLSELSTSFGNNVLDATQAWEKLITDPAQLAGLPELALAAASQAAARKNLQGYLLTLEFPSYFAVITYCDNRALRKEIYRAYSSRASDTFPSGTQWDNQHLINEMLDLRKELSALLGYESYAHYSLANKMAESPAAVLKFLNELAERSLPLAKKEFEQLSDFARQQGQTEALAPWDLSYFSEKLRQQQFDFSEEALRPYFPLNTVLEGLFDIAQRLYDIDIKALTAIDTWHPDVQVFGIYEQGHLIARFYLDLYARGQKKGGAWMGECRVRRRRCDQSLQLPVAYLVCNFTAPLAEQPALLTHREVNTLFHEFGHGLHHMLTKVECGGVSGINGVPWDAVELPSQFFENWCWHPNTLPLLARHYQTAEPLPQVMLDKLLAAKNFQSGMQMLRQLEFALFDFELHSRWGEPGLSVQKLLDDVRSRVAVLPAAEFNRFQCSFSHIFAGGYAAGYYSYKWAEVLSADAFSRFEEEGILNRQTGLAFKTHILEQGGSQPPQTLFEAFRGRPPEVTALLRHSGLL